MKYEIHRTDGTISRMQLVDGVNVADEIAKWPDAEITTVAKVVPVGNFEARPETQAKPMTIAPGTDPQLATLMVQMAEELARANTRLASLEGTIKAVGEAV